MTVKPSFLPVVCRYNAESHLILQLHALWAIQGQRRLCVSTHNRFRGKLQRLLQSKANKTISIQTQRFSLVTGLRVYHTSFHSLHLPPRSSFKECGADLKAGILQLSASICLFTAPPVPHLATTARTPQGVTISQSRVCCRNEPPNNSVLLRYSATSFWKTGPHTKCSQDVGITVAFGSGVI